MGSKIIILVRSDINFPPSIGVDEVLEKVIHTTESMKQKPQTVIIDVSGCRSIRILIEDPLDLIPQGLCGVRLDSEISNDGGKTWRSYGADPFSPGRKLTVKTQKSIGKHYVEERASNYKSQADGTMLLVPSVFPEGTWFRWHLRQTISGPIGLLAELVD